MIVDRIMEKAAEKGASRRDPKMAAWSVGRCVRQNWYMEHKYPRAPINPRSMLIFDLGDRIEDAILEWISNTNVGHIHTDQMIDMVTIPEVNFRVRADFVFECPENLFPYEPGVMTIAPYKIKPPKPGEMIIGEIKSMSDYGFEKAQRGIIDDAYLAQVECYLRAYGCRWGLLVAYRKETSHMCEVLIGRDNDRWEQIKKNVDLARGENVPDRPYDLDEKCAGHYTGVCVEGMTPKLGRPHARCGGTGKEPNGPFIPNFPCGYCDYKESCWGKLNMTVNKDGQPKWSLS